MVERLMASAPPRRASSSKVKQTGSADRRGVSALVLAAGNSSRFLGTKQLARIGGKTLVESVLDSVAKAELRETVVVLGHESEAIAQAIVAKSGVKVVVNSEYRSGMSSSIRIGILALAKDTEGAMLLLGDQPFVSPSFLRRMLRVFEDKGPKARIVAATHRGLVAPPVIFSREYFKELKKLRGDQGAKSVIERHPKALSRIEVRSGKAMTDIDTRADLQAARRLLES